MQSTSRSSNVLQGQHPLADMCERWDELCSDWSWEWERIFFLFFGSTACARCDTTGKKGHEVSGKSKPNFIKSLLLFIHGVEWCLSSIYHWVHKCTRWKATPIFISPIHPLSFLPTPTHRPHLEWAAVVVGNCPFLSIVVLYSMMLCRGYLQMRPMLGLFLKNLITF